MKKWLERMETISVRTYLVILLCIILPLFMTFRLIQRRYESYIQQQLSEQIISSISKSEEALYTSFRNIAGISSAIVTQSALLEAMQAPDKTYFEISKIFDDCVNYTSINNLYADDNLRLTLFDRQGRCYSNWNRNFHNYDFLLEEDWVVEAARSKGHLIWNLFSPSFVIDDKQNYISVARAVFDGFVDGEACGLLIVSMPQAHLSRVLAGYCYEQGDSVYMLGDGDMPILEYAPVAVAGELSLALNSIRDSDEGSLRLETENGTRLVSYYTLEAPWTMGEQALRIVHLTDFQPVVDRTAALSNRMNLIVLLSLVLAALIAAVIVLMLVKPIRRLSGVMGSYKLGGSLHGLDMNRRDEIGQLNRSFQHLTDNIQGLFNDLDREYRVKEQYRFESMRSQLNPHFLFNTLNTIRYMSIMQHMDNITECIDALGAVLKYSMGHEGELSRLSDEIAHVKGYIAIQNMRFGRNIELEEDFEPETLTLYTPRFILQPIVENTIIHGFSENAPVNRRCLVRLYGHVEDDALHLFVEDNGDGVAPETLDALNTGKRPKMTGIGFSHVRELIQLSFGEAYTLTIESQPGEGTIVHYRLPTLLKPEVKGHEESFDRG